jgi:hypothetical protein
MDFAGIISSAALTISAIAKWDDEISERNETLIDISTAVARLSSILDLLRKKAETGELNTIIGPEILALGAVLKKTLEHVEIWRNRRGRKGILALFNPSYVLAKLQNDERKISQQIIELLFAVAVSDLSQNGKPNVHQWIRNHEVLRFWEVHVGNEVQPCLRGLIHRHFLLLQRYSKTH